MTYIKNYFFANCKFDSNVENFKTKTLLSSLFIGFLLLVIFMIKTIIFKDFNSLYIQLVFLLIIVVSLYFLRIGKHRIVENSLPVLIVFIEILSIFFNFSGALPFNFFVDEFYLLLAFLLFTAFYASKSILILNTLLIICTSILAFILKKDTFPNNIVDEFSIGLGVYILVVLIIFIISFLYTHIILKAIDEISNKVKDTEIKNIKLAKNKILLETKQIELTKANEKANESDKLKSEFLANMSHELRTPMNSILGFTDILSNSELSEKQKEFINIIENSGKHLLNLIDDIMDVSKLATNKIKPINEGLNLNTLLNEITKYFVLRLKRENKGHIKIITKYGFSDNDIIITDSKCLRQIIINLIGNAVKFTLFGEINISYKLEENNKILFCIKDTGIGIKENKIPIIFDKFRQADQTTTRVFGGTGLGLSISKSCVELLGGEIWVKSEIEKGSEFYFTIPYKH